MYWFQALDWGYATTDSTLAKTLYLPECSDCARFMINFDDARAKQEHFKGGRITVLSARIASGDKRHAGATPVDVTISSGALRTLTASSRTVDSSPPFPKLLYRVWVRWTGMYWRLVDMKEGVQR